MMRPTTNAVGASLVCCFAIGAPPAAYRDAYDPAQPAVFQVAPHRLLMEAVAGRRVGDALKIGMGRDRNTLALAERGWRGTGFDLPTQGIAQAKAVAVVRKLLVVALVANDVEIGANCSIDRGTFEATTIGEGTKIDNLVMIGHNNQIGRHNMICGQVGLAGSCKTGDYVVMAGQVGVKDHTEIGDQVLIGAQSGVHRNVPSGQQLLGSPALPIREQRRIFQMIARLPEMHKQLRELVTAMERIKLLAAQAGLSLAPLEDSTHEETA